MYIVFVLAFNDVKNWKINFHSIPFRNKIVVLGLQTVISP